MLKIFTFFSCFPSPIELVYPNTKKNTCIRGINTQNLKITKWKKIYHLEYRPSIFQVPCSVNQLRRLGLASSSLVFRDWTGQLTATAPPRNTRCPWSTTHAITAGAAYATGWKIWRYPVEKLWEDDNQSQSCSKITDTGIF